MKNIRMEVVTMIEYIVGGLVFAGIFIIPAIIVSIIEKVKDCKN